MVVESHRSAILALAERQHWVVSRRQLLDLGLSSKAIEHGVGKGRLHPVRQGVYALGRPEVSRLGGWMAAVLSCRSPRRAEDGATGPGEPQALLSHSSAAALWGIAPDRGGVIHVTVRRLSPKRVPGIRAHRRTVLASEDLAVYKLIPTTGVVQTLVDLAGAVRGKALERAVNEADRLDLIDPESLRAALRRHRGRPGVAPLRRLLTDHEFRLTDSELERRFLLLVRRSGLPTPIAGQQLNGFRVDFFWPAIGLVVETDGLRYHRTPAQQARDRLRDQAHVAAGLSTLRFTHRQVRFEGDHVIATLRSALGAR